MRNPGFQHDCGVFWIPVPRLRGDKLHGNDRYKKKMFLILPKEIAGGEHAEKDIGC
jgi:hypothetical protein